METQNNASGIGGLTVVGVVLILLKAFDIIDWSWWLVTSPIWGPILLVLAVLPVIIVAVVISELRN